MNSRAKGRRNENRARDLLIEEGWEVERPNFTRFGNKDFFNLWDLVAVKEGKTRWVQVKTNKMPSPSYRKELAAFQGCGTKELWIWYDRKREPRIILL